VDEQHVDMKTAIVIIEIPYGKDDAMRHWRQLAEFYADKTKSKPGIERLAENVWLIPLDSELPLFGTLVHGVREHHLKCRTLFLDESAQWVSST
jgi:hypothetical protein